MKSLKHHEYVSIGSQNACNRIILVHGWGADAEDLLPLGQEIISYQENEFEILSLRAPHLRKDNNGRQWYDLFPANWQQADREVKKLIFTLKEIGSHDISLSKTVLIGFSQGAAMVIHAGFELDLGLIVSCSGYPHPSWEPNRKCATLISHGIGDMVVPIEASRTIYKKLKEIEGIDCNLYEFNGSHEIDPNFIEIIRQKIRYLF